MTSFTCLSAGVALASLVTVGALAKTVVEPPLDLVSLLDKGKGIYARECAACHGVEGDGEGPGAYILSQKPRNLQLGVFKLRSTPSGEYPTDADLFETITRGIQGATGAQMPSFAAFSEEDRWALVAVVKDFALIDEPGIPIEVPPAPGVNLALGEQVYERLQCASCHGDDGRGEGASSLTLKDDQKERIWTPDLTRGAYKGGGESEEIYTRIFTGLDGSPMPAYGGKATPEEIWALTDYVRSLALPAQEK
ncbi:MAG: c-type cytochrome [Geminicoccaceae bacterium]